MPLMEEAPENIQSSIVSQPSSSGCKDLPVQPLRQGRLKVCRKPELQSQVRTYSKFDVPEFDMQLVKREMSVTGKDIAQKRLARKRKRLTAEQQNMNFKTSNRTKKYLQKPYADPKMEQTRLNAINAKKNRDRKKQELLMLNEKCDMLSEENKELDMSNRSLEARLRAAEEEIAFLRRALLSGVGSARPALSSALESLSKMDSAPAG